MNTPYSMIKVKGRLLDLRKPVIMGILNITPDSFFDGGYYRNLDDVLRRAEKMLSEGATILDVGGASSRPGAEDVSMEEELGRVLPAIEVILRHFPETLISIDTWRTGVAKAAVASGAAMVNDISAGRFDAGFYEMVAALEVPYFLMHTAEKPQLMQQKAVYKNVVTAVLDFLIGEIAKLRALGVRDIILDPGFGFGKTIEHNYELLSNLHILKNVTGLPILAGLSRKSMIFKGLGIKPQDALNGTTALNMVALQQGASILRVHDVKEAREVIQLFEMLQGGSTSGSISAD